MSTKTVYVTEEFVNEVFVNCEDAANAAGRIVDVAKEISAHDARFAKWATDLATNAAIITLSQVSIMAKLRGL